MTCVAWDGRTLAADRLMCNGYTGQSTTKIERFGVELIGITGDLSVGLEVRAWYLNGADPLSFPSSNRNPDKGASLIVVRPSGEVWKFESGPHAFRVEGAFCAFGSGDEAALVAMACGKTAAEAVALAAMFNTTVGHGVDTLELA